MRPIVLAHRGASAHAPENTVAAFAQAVAFGADGVELDVRASADGALAVLHDADLPDGRPVAAVVAGELPASACLLDAALEACGPLLVNVEIKADGPGGGVPLVAPVAAACRSWGGRVLVSSFDADTVDAMRVAAPELATAQLTFLQERPVTDTVAWVAGRGHVAWHPYHGTVDEAAVA